MKPGLPSLHYMIDAAFKSFMISFERSTGVIQHRLLSHSKLCESCKRIPQLLAKLSPQKKDPVSIHHATPFDLESAANKGCRLCDHLWKMYLQRLTAAQHPGLNTYEHQEFCQMRLNKLAGNKRYMLVFLIVVPENDYLENDYFSHSYIVRQIAGKLYFIFISETQGC